MLVGEPPLQFRLAPTVSRLVGLERWRATHRVAPTASLVCSRVGRAVCAGGRAKARAYSFEVSGVGEVAGDSQSRPYSFEVSGVGEVVGDSQSRAYR